jgi:hypothetical protein
VAERKNCSEEEAGEFLKSLRKQPKDTADQKRKRSAWAKRVDRFVSCRTLARPGKQGESPVTEQGEVNEKRRHQRLELEVEVIVRTDSELFPGRTHDISEFGMSAVLPVELRNGEEVELQIRLPSATETIRAIVRHRNVFRHGFEFVQPLHGIFSNDAITGGPHDKLTYFDLSPAGFPEQLIHPRATKKKLQQ